MSEPTKPDLTAATKAVTAALDEVAPEPATVASPNRWVEPANRLRATTRWTLAVFGVIGAAFLGTIPFTELNSLEWPSPAAGLMLGAVITLIGGLIVILRAGSEVFTSRIGSLTDFVKGWEESKTTPFGLKYARYELLQGMAEDPQQLVHEWERARREYWRAAMEAAIAASEAVSEPGQETPNRAETLKQVTVLTRSRFTEIDDATTYISSLAAYRELVMVYRWAQNWISGGAVMVAVGAFIFFATIDGSAADEEQDAAAATPVSGVDVSLSSTSLEDCRGEEGVVVLQSTDTGGEVQIRSGNICQVLAFAAADSDDSSADGGEATVGTTIDPEPSWLSRVFAPWALGVALPAALALAFVIILRLHQGRQIRKSLWDSVLDAPKTAGPPRSDGALR